MQDNSFSGRGWTGFEKALEDATDETKAIANLRRLAEIKISEWKVKAKIAKEQGTSHKLVQQALELKTELDGLLFKAKQHLNNPEQFAVFTPRLAYFSEFKTYIDEAKKEIEQLAAALRAIGKGPAKKRKTNRRRNKRHRKSTRRRRRTLKH